MRLAIRLHAAGERLGALAGHALIVGGLCVARDARGVGGAARLDALTGAEAVIQAAALAGQPERVTGVPDIADEAESIRHRSARRT